MLVPSKNITIQGVSQAVIIWETYYPERKNAMQEVADEQKYFDETSYYKSDVRVDIELPTCSTWRSLLQKCMSH